MCDHFKIFMIFTLVAFCMVSTAHMDVLASHVAISQYVTKFEIKAVFH
jgi:hypothetical protein